MRRILHFSLFSAAALTATAAYPQATTRQCGAAEDPGPACLAARADLPTLPRQPIFWLIDTLSSKEEAARAAAPTSTVVQAFGETWLFTIEAGDWRPRGGKRVSRIGPLPVRPASSYTAEYLRSVFTPGTTAPLHVHSGPEAFFAVAGDTCLETPSGAQIGRGPGNHLMIEGGPPMLLMAIGKVPRRGFALILHDSMMPPTTLTESWQPQGLCARKLAADKAR